MPKMLDLPSAIETLRHYYRENKHLPSFSELAKIFDYRSKAAVSFLVDKFVEAGVVKKDAQGRLFPLNPLKHTVKCLGAVQAGFPSPAEEELVDTLSLDEFLIQKPQATYMLRVSGDSMIEAGIMKDDLVLVERGRRPKPGDIVIAQVDGEWTMKYYKKRGTQIILEPANKKYPVIEPRQELVIAGVVIANVRKY